MFDIEWAEKLASGKELKIRMDDSTSDSGMKTFRGKVEEQNGEVFSIRDSDTQELIKVDIGDVLKIDYVD